MTVIYHISSIFSKEKEMLQLEMLVGDACGNCRGLKLHDNVVKVLEDIHNTNICEQIYIDNMQFGSLASCHIELLLAPSSYSGSCKNSTCIRRKTPNLHFFIYRSLTIMYHIPFFGGECRNLEQMNELFRLLSLRMTMLIQESEIPGATVHVGSEFDALGSYYMLITQSLQLNHLLS